MNHSTVQLSCQMAEDISRKSKRLRLLHNQRGSLQKYCETWVDAYEGEYGWYKQEFGTSEDWTQEEQTRKHSMLHADEALKESMPLIVWITIGQILIQLIWEWWKLHHPSQEAV